MFLKVFRCLTIIFVCVFSFGFLQITCEGTPVGRFESVVPIEDEEVQQKEIKIVKQELNFKDYSSENIDKMFELAKKLDLLDQEKKWKVISFFKEPEKRLWIMIPMMKRKPPIPLDDPYQNLKDMKWDARENLKDKTTMKLFLLERLFHLARFKLESFNWNELEEDSIFKNIFKLITSTEENFELIRGKLLNGEVVDLSGDIFKELPKNLKPILLYYVAWKNKNVQELLLGKGGMVSLRPLISLSRIKKLNLGENEFESLKHLDLLMNLTELNLGKNKIKSLVLEGAKYAAYLTNVEKLNLGENEIKSVDPLSFSTSIEKLYLGKNRIRTLDPLRLISFFKELDCGQQRDEDGNSIEVIVPKKLLDNNPDLKDKIKGNYKIVKKK